jgi:protein disulfide-isomerase-like protein
MLAAGWEERHGHISGDDPTLAELEMTVEEAKSLCDVMDECVSITMERAPSNPEEKVTIFFKGAANLEESPWTSFVHTERLSAKSPAEKHTESQMKQVLDKLGLWWVGSDAEHKGFLAKKPPPPTIVSEPEFGTDELYTGPVLNLVGTTLLNVTSDPTKDVVVNFFAPWCGHCKVFKPQWTQLATNLRHVKTLVFASIDATQNKVSTERVYGFPTIRLYPAKNKDARPEWDGSRDPQAMTKWLQSEASFSFSAEPPNEDDSETVLLMQGAGHGLLGDDEDL